MVTVFIPKRHRIIKLIIADILINLFFLSPDSRYKMKSTLNSILINMNIKIKAIEWLANVQTMRKIGI